MPVKELPRSVRSQPALQTHGAMKFQAPHPRDVLFLSPEPGLSVVEGMGYHEPTLPQGAAAVR
jgi:hypothetical protein